MLNNWILFPAVSKSAMVPTYDTSDTVVGRKGENYSSKRFHYSFNVLKLQMFSNPVTLLQYQISFRPLLVLPWKGIKSRERLQFAFTSPELRKAGGGDGGGDRIIEFQWWAVDPPASMKPKWRSVSCVILFMPAFSLNKEFQAEACLMSVLRNIITIRMKSLPALKAAALWSRF